MIVNVPLYFISRNKFNSSNIYLPFKLKIYSNTLIDTKSIIKPYGINNTFVEVKLNINCNLKISNNLFSKKIKYKREYPLIIKLISGATPNYYSE